MLAHKYPLYMIVGTSALCAVLFHLAERQFVNLEVTA